MSATASNARLKADGYVRTEDGLWRKRVEFATAPRLVVLVRDDAGRLVRVERGTPSIGLEVAR
jgi:hypothetical protein